MKYTVKYRESSGKVRKEEMIFRNMDEAVGSFLHRKDLSLVSCREKKNGGIRSTRMLFEWTCEMDELMASGLTLEESLDLTAGSGGTGMISAEVRDGIRNGMRLSEILSATGWKMPPLYRSMVRIGEETGSMEKVFPRLRDYLGKRRRLAEKILSSLLYPSIVLALTTSCILLMSVFVLPKMKELFSGIAPGTEDVFEKAYGNIRMKAMSVASVLLAAFTALTAARKSGSVKLAEAADVLLLKLPFIGGTLTEYETITFSFGMEILSGTGKPVRESLDECAQLVRNSVYRKEILRTGELVGMGTRFSEALSASRTIPSCIADWVRIGESTGCGGRVFSQIRRNYEGLFEKRLERLTSIIEPSVTVLTGIIFMVAVGEFIIPVFGIYGNL